MGDSVKPHFTPLICTLPEGQQMGAFMISFADADMMPYLKYMWKTCFGDDDLYIDMYFKKRFREDNMLVLLSEDGKPASMLSLLPAELVLKCNKVKKINYIYAGATLPEHRRKGYYSRLLQYALKMINDRKESAVLVPADDKLRGYYANEGFIDAFHLSKLSLSIQKSAIISMENNELDFIVSNITADKYKKLRDNHFFKEGYVCWDTEAVSYAIEETIFCGGECRKILYNNNEYGVLYYIDSINKLCIKEITACGEEAELLSKNLAEYLGCNEIESITSLIDELPTEVLMPEWRHMGGRMNKEAFQHTDLSAAKGSRQESIMNYAMVSKDLSGYSFSYFNLSLG